MNMKFFRKLPIPMDIKEQFPISKDIESARNKAIDEMNNILCGKSEKFMLIIGPCSADNEDSVLDYIYRLRGVQEKVADKILIVPRIYTNKPRTTGEGYKGML
ncbi:MAG: 3-deoxy-7-phosphoheptulonate synthase, partial [Clostridia bacterium]|nr:3-deoxy-7-phosphoheptulonate synthase [Clostridia bacterium]